MLQMIDRTRDAETDETKRDIRLRISLHHPISLRRDIHIRQMCYNLNRSRIAKSFRPGEKSGQDRFMSLLRIKEH